MFSWGDDAPPPPSAAGVWYTPFPVSFSGEDGTYQAEDGSEITCDGYSVTVAKDGVSMVGKLSADCTQMQFDNGAKWKKQIIGRGLEPGEDVPSGEQEDLLSESAVASIVDRLNKRIDVWGLSESTERKIIESFVKAGNALLKPAIESFGSSWVPILIMILDETKSREETYEVVRSYIIASFRDPLVEHFNGKIDIPLVGEEKEAEMLTSLVDRLVDIIVPLALDGLDRTGASVHPIGALSDEAD